MQSSMKEDTVSKEDRTYVLHMHTPVDSMMKVLKMQHHPRRGLKCQLNHDENVYADIMVVVDVNSSDEMACYQ